MDIKIEKKPWYIRHRYSLIGGGVLAILFIYLLYLSWGPSSQRIDRDDIRISQVKGDKFLEYVDVEGVVHPILTQIINTRESGSVKQIVADEGSMLQKGDTILLLDNPELMRTIEDLQDEWESKVISYQEKEVEMKQKNLNLQLQSLQTRYELERLRKSMELDQEEYKMGVKSKAQLEIAEDEYRYKKRSAELQHESLQQDSAMSVIRRDLLKNDHERERKKYERSRGRMNDLVVTAPIDGQLSYVRVIPGQQVSANENIAEIKKMDQFKIHTSVSEYYIDRIVNGLPATISYQGKKYPLKISKVVPEIKERTFSVDLVFTDSIPENVRVGKSFRVLIELGQPEEALIMERGNSYQYTGGRWIYKLNEDRTKAVRTPISIGRQNPKQYEILEGLHPGDWVISSGYDQFGEAEELLIK